MQITKDKFVAFNYTLKDKEGKILDSTEGTQPLAYLHGNGYIIPGLEKALEGKTQGDKFSVTVEPEDAYGIRDERLVTSVPRDRFETDAPIEIGMKFQVLTPAGPTIVTVTKVQEDQITVDGNHDLADKVLCFDIEIVEVKEPTEEDLAIFNMHNQSCGCGGGCGSCDGACGDCGGDCGGDCSCGGESCCN